MTEIVLHLQGVHNPRTFANHAIGKYGKRSSAWKQHPHFRPYAEGINIKTAKLQIPVLQFFFLFHPYPIPIYPVILLFISNIYSYTIFACTQT